MYNVFHKFCVCVCTGADLSDYFNYGFNEDTWKAYCEKQKRLRMGLEVSTVGSVTSKITVRDHCSLYPFLSFHLLPLYFPSHPSTSTFSSVFLLGGFMCIIVALSMFSINETMFNSIYFKTKTYVFFTMINT